MHGRETRGSWRAHLQGTRLAATHDDDAFSWPTTRCLPTRRRFWEKVLRNTDHSGTKAQLRSQLQIVFRGHSADGRGGRGFRWCRLDFIYDQISTDLLNSGELEREYDEIIRKQRDGTSDGQPALQPVRPGVLDRQAGRARLVLMMVCVPTPKPLVDLLVPT